MKSIFFLVFVVLAGEYSFGQESIFELTSEQSMSITGKGPGQDAAINPYTNVQSFAIVTNIGENNFEIRVQTKGKVIQKIEIAPKEIKKVFLDLGYELYLDSTLESKAKVEFKPKE